MPEQVPQLGLGKAGQLGEAPAQERRQHRRGQGGDMRTRGSDERRRAFDGGRRMLRDELRQQEFGRRRRPVGERLERRLAAAAHEIVRVFAVGQEHETRVLAVREHGQRILERAPRRLAPGGVAVEAENDAIRLAEQLLRRGRASWTCRAWRPRSRCRAGRARRRPCSLRRRSPYRPRESPAARDTGRRARAPSRTAESPAS